MLICDRSQDVLPQSMVRMLEQIEKETGMAGTLILGGPEPRQGGAILMLT